MTTKKFSFNNPQQLVRHALSLAYFRKVKGKVAIPHLWRPGKGKLVVVVGENASGKSFFRRIVSVICHEAAKETEWIGVSMEGRTKVSTNPWLALVYGDENWQATGEISASTVTVGLNTSAGRTSRHVIFWDEPDLGLSDSWAKGMGQKFAAFSKAKSAHLISGFIVTHNRALVSELLAADPHYLHLGKPRQEAPQTLREWVENPVKPRDIDELKDEAHARFKLIQAILDRKG